MRTVNRSALVVRPRDPYLRWASELDEDSAGLAESIRGKSSVYLVAPDPQEEHESAPIEQYYERIFELELEAWHTDPDDWPRVRDYRTFQEWFDVDAESIVVDLEGSPLRGEHI
ncbi:hypothetical protein ACFL6M_07050 [Candidatus Eisenbacteria bacterium]|uniref:Uncharacterized protein n=1 Tax=Eiseniibacteriota bacterium TaxID=2212470 RepID=A0ABV6YMC9_UNCEI